MKVHFVCTSNTFRSRLAETYLKSKKLPNINVSSSGVVALSNPNGPITWYAQRIIQEDKLVPFEKMIWTQTTKELLEAQDLVIFMEKSHYEHCVSQYKFKGKNYAVWEIPDVYAATKNSEQEAIQATEQAYNKIKVNIEDLIAQNFQLKSA